jgi:hypothetical protein
VIDKSDEEIENKSVHESVCEKDVGEGGDGERKGAESENLRWRQSRNREKEKA